MYNIRSGVKEHSKLLKLMENIDWDLFQYQKD